MLHYLGTNNGNNSATLVAVFKTEQLFNNLGDSHIILSFQGSGDDAALAKMLKVIRFLVGHLVHFVKVK